MKRDTPEQRARELLDRMDIDGALAMTAGDVVELANIIAERDMFLDAVMGRLPAHAFEALVHRLRITDYMEKMETQKTEVYYAAARALAELNTGYRLSRVGVDGNAEMSVEDAIREGTLRLAPEINLPDIEMPNIEIPNIEVPDMAAAIRELHAVTHSDEVKDAAQRAVDMIMDAKKPRHS